MAFKRYLFDTSEEVSSSGSAAPPAKRTRFTYCMSNLGRSFIMGLPLPPAYCDFILIDHPEHETWHCLRCKISFPLLWNGGIRGLKHHRLYICTTAAIEDTVESSSSTRSANKTTVEVSQAATSTPKRSSARLASKAILEGSQATKSASTSSSTGAAPETLLDVVRKTTKPKPDPRNSSSTSSTSSARKTPQQAVKAISKKEAEAAAARLRQTIHALKAQQTAIGTALQPLLEMRTMLQPLVESVQNTSVALAQLEEQLAVVMGAAM